MTTVIFREKLTEKSFLDEFKLKSSLVPDEDLFQEIWDLHPAERSTVVLYGKEMAVPRYQKSYMRDYSFSGNTAVSDPLPKILKPYLKWCNSLGYGEFNQFLLNWYEDGTSYIGSHADDERQLVPNSPIVTITLSDDGTVRTFRIRDKKTKKIERDVPTTNGMVLVMCGEFQKEFKHEIVKITGSKAEKVGRRISITLRQFN